MKVYPNLIDSVDVDGDTRANINPSDTKDTIGLFVQATPEHADTAIAAAKAAQPAWAAKPPGERAGLLESVAAAVTAQEEGLARMLAREEGKTIREALGEVRRAAYTFRYYAGQILNPVGSLYQGLATDMRVHTVRRAVGVVGVITPWNFPIAIPAWKIAPALAYGNAVVFKPADLVPGSAWMLAQILRDVGIPPGVFNLVMGRGSVVGQRIVESRDVDAISFTGSTSVGIRMAQDSARQSLKKLQLEMGGKNPLIVMDDADLDVAVAAAIDGAFGSTGQRCTASSRLIVQRGIHDRFVDALTAAMKGLRVGSALDESTSMGPAVSQDQLDQDIEYMRIGVEEGAQLVAGGNRVDAATPGFFVEPTLFVGGTTSMRINQEEIFGPVACVVSVDDLDEALEVANDSQHGLSAGIITESLRSAGEFQRRAQAGILTVNRSTASTDYHAPFGGIKQSSHGSREQGQAAQDFFTTVVTVYTAGSQW